jgi:hypothetical protein
VIDSRERIQNEQLKLMEDEERHRQYQSAIRHQQQVHEIQARIANQRQAEQQKRATRRKEIQR